MAEVEELPPARVPEEREESEEESAEAEDPKESSKKSKDDLKETLHLIEEATGQKMLQFEDEEDEE